MPSMIHRLTAPSRLLTVGAIFFAAWCVVFIVRVERTEGLIGPDNNAIGLDFMAFYTAGTIILDGRARSLYDHEHQQSTQTRIIAPEVQDGFYHFINPASVAVAYSVLARLPYRIAFYAHTSMMLGFFLIGMCILKSQLSTGRCAWLAAIVIGVSWFPMTHTITGGQNAALTFMLLTLAYAATVHRQQWLAGLAIGLLFYKPQYALPILGLLLLRGEFRTVAFAILGVASHYLLGAWQCGWDWPVQMIDALGGYFKEQGRLAHGHTVISIVQAVDFSLIQPLQAQDAPAALISTIKVLAFASIAGIILWLVWIWRTADVRRGDFGLYWALAVAANLLISMHTQYYDAALLILSVLLVIDYRSRHEMQIGSRARAALMLVYFGYPMLFVFDVARAIRFQPVLLISIGVGLWATMTLWTSRGHNLPTNDR